MGHNSREGFFSWARTALGLSFLAQPDFERPKHNYGTSAAFEVSEHIDSLND